MRFLLLLCVLSFPTSAFTDSHSLWFIVTYIEGETPFPEYSVVFMLDDITVGYYDSETKVYIPRGNTTNEDEEVDLINYELNRFLPSMLGSFIGKFKNKTERVVVHQLLNVCELLDNDKPGQMVTTIAFEGSTTEEMRFIDDTLTFQGKEKATTMHLEFCKWQLAVVHPLYTRKIRMYLKKRAPQWKRRVKPRVRLFQKANPDPGGFVVSCLATGFYPRHINLTLLRNGQPVSDHKVTGGELLPNGDGTYQMRKSLQIRTEETETHKYTCSAIHLSLNNKLDVELEFDHSEPFKSLIPLVLMILMLMLMLVFGVAAVKWKRQRAESSKSGVSTTSSSEENVQTKLNSNDVMS